MSESDEFCKEFLDKPNKQEARSWLENSEWAERNIGQLRHAESLGAVEELYRRGAKEVFVVDLLEDIDLSETTDTLVVILPEDHEARTRVLEWCSAHSEEEGFGPVDDEGQKYVFLWWD